MTWTHPVGGLAGGRLSLSFVYLPGVSMTGGSCGRPPLQPRTQTASPRSRVSPREKPHTAHSPGRMLFCSSCCRGNITITTCKPWEVSLRVSYCVCLGVVTASPLFCPTSPWVCRAAHVSSPCGGQDAEGIEVSLQRGAAEVPPAPANCCTVSRGDSWTL